MWGGGGREGEGGDIFSKYTQEGNGCWYEILLGANFEAGWELAANVMDVLHFNAELYHYIHDRLQVDISTLLEYDGNSMKQRPSRLDIYFISHIKSYTQFNLGFLDRSTRSPAKMDAIVWKSSWLLIKTLLFPCCRNASRTHHSGRIMTERFSDSAMIIGLCN